MIVFEDVDLKASYPGGEKEMWKFIWKNLRYPENALENGIEGVVEAEILILDNGEICNVSFINDPGGGTANEVLKIIKLMPKWIPAKENGLNINSVVKISVTFKFGK